jgi:hypothetical protein
MARRAILARDTPSAPACCHQRQLANRDGSPIDLRCRSRCTSFIYIEALEPIRYVGLLLKYAAIILVLPINKRGQPLRARDSNKTDNKTDRRPNLRRRPSPPAFHDAPREDARNRRRCRRCGPARRADTRFQQSHGQADSAIGASRSRSSTVPPTTGSTRWRIANCQCGCRRWLRRGHRSKDRS